MKGPKPVWMLATNRLNQSSPRPAAAVPAGCGFAGRWDSARTAIRSLITLRSARRGCRGGYLLRRRWLRCRQKLRRVGGVLVFRHRLQRFHAHAEDQRVAFVLGMKTQ